MCLYVHVLFALCASALHLCLSLSIFTLAQLEVLELFARQMSASMPLNPYPFPGLQLAIGETLSTPLWTDLQINYE